MTGHYARVTQDESTGRFLLRKAVDKAKDQSYFLACLNQEQLGRVLFPLGEMTKEQARQIAEENGLITARKKDSQDICFIPDGDYVTFMRRYTQKNYPTGNYLDLSGNIVGTHQGAIHCKQALRLNTDSTPFSSGKLSQWHSDFRAAIEK